MAVSTDPYRLRTLTTVDEFALSFGVLADAFGDDFSDVALDRSRLVFEPDRNHVVEHSDDGPVATAGAYTRDVTVPGGTVAAAHVTLVGVRQTHRRRGLLTRLMRHQLNDVRRRGEPIAMLWASEGPIYQRFGYGLAAQRHSMTISTRDVGLTDPKASRARQPRDASPAGRLRDASPPEVRKDLQSVYERVLPTRPGWSSRDNHWWDLKVSDPPSLRDGHTATRALLFEGPAGVGGYALWRRKTISGANGPHGEIHVAEVIAATPDAYVALWRFLLSVDLTRTVRCRLGAADEPLRYLVGEPRALGVQVGDALWVRVVDVPAALSARRYAAGIDVVLEVTDDLLPGNAGRWRLTGNTDGATCAPTTDPVALSCDIADLGALYLGGTPLGALTAGGRVRELRPGAAAAAAAAFGWYRAPSALDTF
ncbi:MAG: hypothetical protein QOE03_347 [Micromonosporaceae bacterium]|jgi:predicted acetyltransferase|nr:hypothetical protein [Micromonosporaceae bacterium]